MVRSTSEHPIRSKPPRAYLFSLFFMFFVFGCTENLRGPTLPLVMKDLGIGYTVTGTVLLASYLGFTTASFVAGVLSDRIGRRKVVFLACTALLVGILLYTSSSFVPLLFLGMLFIGFGLGSMELSGNAGIADLPDAKKGRYFNLLGFCHGLAAMTMPYLAAVLMENGTSWRTVYRLDLVLVLALFLIFVAMGKKATPPPTLHASLNARSFRKAAFAPKMLWFYLLVASYVSAEIGLATWLVSFLQETKGFTLTAASLHLSLFFASLTLGRLLGSFIVDRYGFTRILTICAAGSLMFIGIGILGPPGLAFLIPLSGLFHSVVFPTVTGEVSSIFKGNAGTALGVFFAFAGIGGMGGSWIIGFFSDLLGTKGGFGTILVMWTVVGTATFLSSRSDHPVEVEHHGA
jgi:fucose permease